MEEVINWIADKTHKNQKWGFGDGPYLGNLTEECLVDQYPAGAGNYLKTCMAFTNLRQIYGGQRTITLKSISDTYDCEPLCPYLALQLKISISEAVRLNQNPALLAFFCSRKTSRK